MSLNDLAAEVYAVSSSKGFWPAFGGLYRGEDGEVHTSTGRNVGEVLALIHSEVSEALEAWRDCGDEGIYALKFSWHSTPGCYHPDVQFEDGKANVFSNVEDKWIEITDEMYAQWGWVRKPVGFPSELADVIIRVLDACGAWQIDIDTAVREKIAYNRTREILHGRAK